MRRERLDGSTAGDFSFLTRAGFGLRGDEPLSLAAAAAAAEAPALRLPPPPPPPPPMLPEPRPIAAKAAALSWIIFSRATS
jgi:hypothetical protein